MVTHLTPFSSRHDAARAATLARASARCSTRLHCTFALTTSSSRRSARSTAWVMIFSSCEHMFDSDATVSPASVGNTRYSAPCGRVGTDLLQSRQEVRHETSDACATIDPCQALDGHAAPRASAARAARSSIAVCGR